MVNSFYLTIKNYFKIYLHNPQKQGVIGAIGLITFAGLLATALGVIGSLVQARFISPEDLGFIRKYSVISSYAVFLNLGLFTILQREYPVLIGQGKSEQARRAAAIVQSWILLSSGLVCGILLTVVIAELFQQQWREAAGLFIQIIAVWSTLYIGYLDCTFRSRQEFERLAKGNIFSSIAGIAILPLFWFLPFLALVLRSITSQMVFFSYLHIKRPVKVGWCLPWKEFLLLVKRGMRLYVGTYLRYTFWLTVEIWLMLQIGGDKGVGLFVFSKLIADSITQLSSAINQVYLPRVGQMFGKTGSIHSCLRLSIKPTLINILISSLFTVVSWVILPTIITYAFPRYIEAIPIFRILIFQGLIVSISIPIYMVTVLEDYLTQLMAATIGLGIFVGMFFWLRSLGFDGTAVAWGTLAGQAAFAVICLISIQRKALTENKRPL